jgi:hypothetical protein
MKDNLTCNNNKALKKKTKKTTIAHLTSMRGIIGSAPNFQHS